MNRFAVIMAGGSGTRFWPLSRRRRPKQLLPLAGDGATPLIAATFARVAGLVAAERTIVVTSEALGDATRNTLPGLRAEQFLLEPVGRNTAPCVAWATSWIARRDPRGIAIVLPADAYIADARAFVGALETATQAAHETGAVVTIGIRPTRPETGYGYLHVGDPTEIDGVKRVRAFVEKPDAATAEQYVRGGQHLWNAGIFVFRVDTMLAAIAEHLPSVSTAMRELDDAARDQRETARVRELYSSLPNVSIDYAIMEKLAEVCVVPSDCGWSDVGSWQAAWELADKDAAGNASRTSDSSTAPRRVHEFIDATNNLVVAPPGKNVALIGVSDLVVVDTGDVVLVVPRARSQEVRRAIDALAARGEDDIL